MMYIELIHPFKSYQVGERGFTITPHIAQDLIDNGFAQPVQPFNSAVGSGRIPMFRSRQANDSLQRLEISPLDLVEVKGATHDWDEGGYSKRSLGGELVEWMFRRQCKKCHVLYAPNTLKICPYQNAKLTIG